MVPLTTDDLMKTLQEKGVKCNIQEETGQIYFGFEAKEKKFAVFMRIFPQSQLLQIVVFLPAHFTDVTKGETARLLHWVNQAVDLPGFCMEEKGKTVFYRLMLPALKMQFDDQLLAPFLNAVKGLAETFFPIIETVATGKESFEEASKKAAEAKK